MPRATKQPRLRFHPQLLERLNTKALQGLTLRGADRMRALDPNIVVDLQLKFGPTYAALRETILAEAYSGVEVVARNVTDSIEMFDYLSTKGASVEVGCYVYIVKCCWLCRRQKSNHFPSCSMPISCLQP
jgi:hypothetical protein